MRKSLWKKRLLSLVTVLALILIIFTYTKFTISAEIDEKEIVVTKVDIPPRTLITEDMLETIVVPSRGIPNNTWINAEDVIGQYTVAGYGISKHSFIYKEKLVTQNQMPDAGILELKENEVAFPLLVDLETSLGNSIIPDSNVDLYFRTLLKGESSNESKAIYGKLASQVRVVAVKDADASNVFDPEGYQNGEEQNVTKEQKLALAKIYIFAIPQELNETINKAKLLGDIVPIATGKSYSKSTETKIEENKVIEYIQNSSFEQKEKSKEGEE